jgi:hypothetical protein
LSELTRKKSAGNSGDAGMRNSVQVDEMTPGNPLYDERRKALQHELTRTAKRIECTVAGASNR